MILLDTFYVNLNLILLIVTFGTGFWIGMYVTSQIDKKIDTDIDSNRKDKI